MNGYELVEFDKEAFAAFYAELESYRDSQFRIPPSVGSVLHDYDDAMYEAIPGHRYENPCLIQLVNCSTVPQIQEARLSGLNDDIERLVFNSDSPPYMVFSQHFVETGLTMMEACGFNVRVWTLLFFQVLSVDQGEGINLTECLYGKKNPTFDDILEVVGELKEGSLLKFAGRILSSPLPIHVGRFAFDKRGLHESRALALYSFCLAVIKNHKE